MRFIALLAVFAAMTTPPASAQSEPVDYDMVNKIMDEGFNRSHVMDTLTYLTDVIGPRLTNSPGMRQAEQWTKGEFAGYGLKNAHLESYPFGRGWTYEDINVHMTAPRNVKLQAMPKAWHPGTNGVIAAEAVRATIKTKEDFEKYKGKLAGKAVLLDPARDQDEPDKPIFKRLSETDLAEREEYDIPDSHKPGAGRFKKILQFQEDLAAFLAEEKAAALVFRSRRDAGLLDAAGYQHAPDNTPKTPAVVVASEDYDRMARLIDRGEKVAMSIDVQASYYDDNYNANNVIAEIPGRGSNPEIVMAGAHLDSWFMGDGAADNGAGSAVIMEAARILSALGVKPKRTIRFALWSGEEQGLYGSINYVQAHFASRPDDSGDKYGIKYLSMNDSWPIKRGADYERLSGYFNIDNGSGRLRGVYCEGNAAVMPIFKSWLAPFHDLGADTVIMSHTGGTDHESFQAMGLPGFQFIQDPLDYGSRLHHTDIDTASHVYEKDLEQAAVILATFLWETAERDERLPRKPFPTKPE